jgi:K(+)-stimulated pyrophosphate-energized sodium pump
MATLILIAAFVVSGISFAVAYLLYAWVARQDPGQQRIVGLCALIRDGANTFLRREYRILARFCGIITILIILFIPHPFWLGSLRTNLVMAAAYLAGTCFSALAGKIGIQVATIANGRCASAATIGIKSAFLTGFRGGAVMGMAVVGSSLVGVSALLMLTGDATTLLGFSFGASSLALFAKAGGGIFTKTADISADLTGKVELGIPEDDPRNPAVIADNVGDNVGDVAGMGADLFDSNVASMSAALVMALFLDGGVLGTHVTIVISYATLGLLASIIGVGTARMGRHENPSVALNGSTYVTTFLFLLFTTILTAVFDFPWRIWGATTVGLAVGTIIGLASDYFTNDAKRPVHQVAKASRNGPAFTILGGISYGFVSVLPGMAGIAVASMASYLLCAPLGPGHAFFGISMSALGMLSIVGMIISNDAYGPIVDNARGLVEMGSLGEKALEVTDSLDSAGNTVKAITKGFAIAAAGLTVISLLGAFITEVNTAAAQLSLEHRAIDGFDIMDPSVFFGLLIGAAIPAVFSAMLMMGVDRNAQRMVTEIHRQFKEIPGLKEGRPGVMPEYGTCIDIATTGALRELVPAGLMAILITLAVGFIGGVTAIGGYLAGNIISGLLLALFMSNAGGLWDNAKKYIESGTYGGRGSDAHKAAVIGDTVGDPFKDTAGPSLNTQITVVSLVSSIMAPLFLVLSVY